jgi:peptidase E
MSASRGKIVLMGSGELTATMVEVHKELLAGFKESPQAVFLDTPAGFQLNVDLLSQKAVDYFHARVQRPLAVVSFKSYETPTPYEAEKAFHSLREADFVLIGPGSPTYALRQWHRSPIPDILKKRIEAGGCLVAASAAALTVGRLTLPVYEIYKVGEDLHWVEGMDILGHFGFNLVVIPHWNNAEGGTHDTRFCYMGETRFRKLESLLQEDVSIFGLDEHTACIIDLEKGEMSIKGIGRVTLRRQDTEMTFEKGESLSLEVLRGRDVGKQWQRTNAASGNVEQEAGGAKNSFWNRIHAIRSTFQNGLDKDIPEESTSTLLELDGLIWKAQQELESEELVTQAREVERDMIALLGSKLASSPSSTTKCIAPLVEELLTLRLQFRQQKKWSEADAIRDCLARLNIVIEDTKDGSRWRLKS